MATTVLLVNQNKLLEVQNKKIDIQNEMIEGQRRSSLVLLMSNLLEDLSKEIDSQKRGLSESKLIHLDSVGYSLSKPLIGRISSICQGFLPYKMLVNGKLSEQMYSPEKGQLLLALLGSNLSDFTLNEIYKKTSFSRSYLKEARLEGAMLNKIDLNGAYLEGARLDSTSLLFAQLNDSNFENAKIRSSDFASANINSSNFKNTTIQNTSFLSAKCYSCDFSNSTLIKVDLKYALLAMSKFISAKSGYVDFAHSDLSFAEFFDIGRPSYFYLFMRAGGQIESDIEFYLIDLDSAKLLHTKFIKIFQTSLIQNFTYIKGLKSLYGSKNLPPSLKKEVGLKPCLIKKNGCSLRGISPPENMNEYLESRTWRNLGFEF